MSRITIHGENIAGQINSEDCYGRSGELTYADVWNIVDQLHTHFMDTNRNTEIFEKWMEELHKIDPEMEV